MWIRKYIHSTQLWILDIKTKPRTKLASKQILRPLVNIMMGMKLLHSNMQQNRAMMVEYCKMCLAGMLHTLRLHFNFKRQISENVPGWYVTYIEIKSVFFNSKRRIFENVPD